LDTKIQSTIAHAGPFGVGNSSDQDNPQSPAMKSLWGFLANRDEKPWGFLEPARPQVTN
jgi:hypothetical protein